MFSVPVNEVRGDVDSHERGGPIRLSGPPVRDLLKAAEYACQFSARSPANPELAVPDTGPAG